MGEGIGGVWKALALVCVTILVAGAPGIVYAIRTWSVSADVHTIRERQDDVRIRLSVVEENQRNLQAQVADLQRQVDVLHSELNQHIQQGVPTK